MAGVLSTVSEELPIVVDKINFCLSDLDSVFNVKAITAIEYDARASVMTYVHSDGGEFVE